MTQYPVLGPAFLALIGSMIVLEIVVTRRRTHAPSLKAAAGWVGVWMALAAAFALGLGFLHGREPALQFATGYVLEQALSVDNMFIFVLIFRYFAVPLKDQPRVLHWGVIGAVVLRLLFIALGVELIRRLHWVTFVFGAILLYTAWTTWRGGEERIHPSDNPAVRALKKLMPVLDDHRESSFFSHERGRWHATPLFAALLAVEFADVIFALDSIPAVIAVTQDPFIVYTSNVFAIMGLRALFFLVAELLEKLPFLQTAVSIVIGFAGAKMLFEHLIHIPTWASLAVIAATFALTAAVWAFSARSRRAAR